MPRSPHRLLAKAAPAPDEPPPPPKPKRADPRRNAEQVKIAMRRDRALKLATMGLSYRRIAQQLTIEGYECGHETVARDLHYLYKEVNADSEAAIQRLRLVQQARGNQIISSLLPQLLDVPTNPKTKLPLTTKPAYERQYMLCKLLLELEAHEAKLFGAFAPTKVQQEMTGKDGGPIQTESNHEHQLAILTTEQLALLAELARVPRQPASGAAGDDTEVGPNNSGAAT